MSEAAENQANPAMKMDYCAVYRRESLAPEEFFSEYIGNNRPVLVKGALKDCEALSRWTADYIGSVSGKKKVKLKEGLYDYGVMVLKTVDIRLSDYIDSLESYESLVRTGVSDSGKRQAYLHEVPLPSILPRAGDDLKGFQSEYFPKFYRRGWLKYAKFFLGPCRSLTSLHFDCLLTHNLFLNPC